MSPQLKAGDKAPNFRFDSPWKRSQDFFEDTQHRDAVLVFLRYHGCPICQMELSNLRRDVGLFNKRQAKLYVILQSSTDTLTPLLKKEEWPFDLVCDPGGEIYRLYSVEPGGVMKYLHPAGLVATIRAMGSGFSHLRFEGKETQVPAVFVIAPDRTVKYAHYGTHISDLPRPNSIAAHLDGP